MERHGFAVRIGDSAVRLTEEGKAWLNRTSGSAGAEEAVGAKTLNHDEVESMRKSNHGVRACAGKVLTEALGCEKR